MQHVIDHDAAEVAVGGNPDLAHLDAAGLEHRRRALKRGMLVQGFTYSAVALVAEARFGDGSMRTAGTVMMLLWGLHSMVLERKGTSAIDEVVAEQVRRHEAVHGPLPPQEPGPRIRPGFAKGLLAFLGVVALLVAHDAILG